MVTSCYESGGTAIAQPLPVARPSLEPDPVWGAQTGTFVSVARNMSTRYLVIAIDTLIGLVILPFNVHHLGQAAYGLWMLTTSINTYFGIFDLGYGGSVTRYVAHYRALRDARSINEIVSTLAAVFTLLGVVAYFAFVVVAFNVDRVFKLTPDQIDTARILLLVSGTQVALGFPYSVFGGVMNGFQRYDLNNFVSIATSVVVAVVNVVMLTMGCSLVQLVIATTAVRLLSKEVYRANAYSVFPALSVKPSFFKRSRLREVTGFSVYIAVINWSNKLNYASDALIIGMFLSPAAVALWAVPRRLGEAVRSFTNQFNAVLMPVIVDSAARKKSQRLRMIFLQGTRLSLVLVTPFALGLFMMADRLIPAWVGSGFAGSVVVAQILAVVIAFRVGNSTAGVVLKGAGQHKMLAITNAVAAVANVLLSVLWIQWYGLAGQAFGTLVPVAAASVLYLWPAACKRVGVGIGEAFMSAVWPTLWPAPVFVAVVWLLRGVMPARLITVLLTILIGSLCYGAVFLAFAISREDRSLYLSKITALTRLCRAAQPQAA